MADDTSHNRFGLLLESMTNKRWKITLINLGTFAFIVLGIVAAIMMQTPVASEWKELLLLLLGAFIGNYNKVGEFWFSNEDRDKLLVQKMDEEDGVSMSHTNDMKETNKPVTPIIPDAFVAGAQAARELAVVENQQNFELAKDQQEHEQEMEKLEFEHHEHRQCEHVWGDSDHDGHEECQKCGLLKEQYNG